MKNLDRLNFTKVLPVFLVYVVMGFVDIVGVATGFVKQDFGLDDQQAQLLPSMIFVWFFILSVPTGLLMDRFGKKSILLAGIVLTGVGMMLPFVRYSFPVMLTSFIFLGIGNTIVQVAANPLLHDVVPSNKYSSYLSTTQFIKAICSMSGPLIASYMALKFGNWKLVFAIYAFVSALSILWLLMTRISEQQTDKISSTFKTCFKLLGNKFVLFMVLGIFLYVGAEVGINTNIVSFLQSKYGIPLESASYSISLFFTALMIGRFSGAVLLNWIESKKFFLITVIFSLIGVIGMLLSPSLFLSKVFLFLIGLGFANVFPLIFSITVAKMPDRVNEISGLMIMAISGGAIVPPIMGLVSSSLDPTASFLVVAVVVVYLLIISSITIKNNISKI